MEQRKLGEPGLKITCLGLGTWAFGGDVWWGHQEDKNSIETLYRAIDLGINFIDTAPVYGKGRSEKVIGRALREKGLRDKVILATKVGLSWKGPLILHNLKKKRILEEIDASLKHLQTDVIDLYQVHWPDPDTTVKETAETIRGLYEKGKIRAIGVSNHSVGQMKEFMKYCPLHSLQPPYNMFRREIEKDIIPFCIEHNIGIIAYAPLDSGILTGKFFSEGGEKIPKDRIRSINPDIKGRNFEINKEFIIKLKDVASKYEKTMSQLALNWVITRPGITCAIAGSRKISQIEENIGGADWQLSPEDSDLIQNLLKERQSSISPTPSNF